MKTIFKSLKLQQRKCHFLPLLTLFFAVLIAWVPPTLAEQTVTYEGTIQGAACVHYKQTCPADEAHIAMENDFVLLLSSGEHLFLPNLNQAVKARYVNRSVRVRGEKEIHSIWVDTLEIKKGKIYQQVWSFLEQQKMYRGGGG